VTLALDADHYHHLSCLHPIRNYRLHRDPGSRQSLSQSVSIDSGDVSIRVTHYKKTYGDGTPEHSQHNHRIACHPALVRDILKLLSITLRFCIAVWYFYNDLDR